MASLAELARLRTDLEGPQIAHLQRLVGTWGLLADFCFADLLLYAPVRGEVKDSFIILGQIRPATTQTVYRSDWVGSVVTADERPLVANSFRSGEVSSNAGGLLIWPAKGLILLGFISMFFQWMSELIKRVAIMKGQLVDEEAGGHSVEAEAERLIQEIGTVNTPGTGGTPPGDGIS